MRAIIYQLLAPVNQLHYTAFLTFHASGIFSTLPAQKS